MTEHTFQEWSLKEWSDFFSDPASALFASGEGPTLSPSLRLALWLEFFLLKGGGEVKGWLASLPDEVLTDLGTRLLQCYLSQPLYIRIFRGVSPSVLKRPLNFIALGNLYQVEQGSGEKKRTEILYALDHRRLWPEGIQILPDSVLTSETVFSRLEPDIRIAAASRLEKIRIRGQTLKNLFQEGKPQIFREAFSTDGKPPSLTDQSVEGVKGEEVIEEKEVDSLEPDKPPALETQDHSPPPVITPKKKKKQKSSSEQLELFQ